MRTWIALALAGLVLEKLVRDGAHEAGPDLVADLVLPTPFPAHRRPEAAL